MTLHDPIIVALLALAGSMFGSYMSNNKNSIIMQERLKSLEEKVNKHNNLVERMYKCETEIKVLQERVEEEAR